MNTSLKNVASHTRLAHLHAESGLSQLSAELPTSEHLTERRGCLKNAVG